MFKTFSKNISHQTKFRDHIVHSVQWFGLQYFGIFDQENEKAIAIPLSNCQTIEELSAKEW